MTTITATPFHSAIARSGEPLAMLIIDDDDLDRRAVKRHLQHCGLHVRSDEAVTAAETTERLRTERYDCILLDYYIPGVDGLALLEEIRAAAPHTPIVIFTGRGDEEIAVELMKAGAADYLPKASLSPERLAAAVRHGLEVTRAASARRHAEGLLRLSSDAARHLLAATDEEALVGGLFEKIKEVLGVDAYFKYSFDESGSARLSSCKGIDKELMPSADVSVDRPFVAALAMLRREPVLSVRIQQSDDVSVQVLKDAGFLSAYCVPLLAEYRLLGALGFASRSKEEFTAEELDFLETMGHYVASAHERLTHIERLRESDRRKTEFLATLSHEMRDPLGPLANLLEGLGRSDSGGLDLATARAAMLRQVDHLQQLVDELLDVSRIAQDKLTLRKRETELEHVVTQAVGTVTGLFEAAGLQLRVALPPASIRLNADPVRLAQVLCNLLRNACTYSERGGRVQLTVERHGNEAVIKVRDEGVGIPKEKLESVFDMFSQAHMHLERSRIGLGIGLTLVKRLVEMHGGDVAARSEGRGKGSEFVVRLPTLGETAQPVSEPETRTQASSSLRVLVVDDNRDSAMSLALLLQSTGHSTVEAHDGPQALDAAEQFRPDVVLLDIGLPRMNGYEVCRRIRERPWGQDPVIVALTGWGQDEDRRRSREAGFDQHVIKPVAYSALTRLLAESVRARRGGVNSDSE